MKWLDFLHALPNTGRVALGAAGFLGIMMVVTKPKSVAESFSAEEGWKERLMNWGDGADLPGDDKIVEHLYHSQGGSERWQPSQYRMGTNIGIIPSVWFSQLTKKERKEIIVPIENLINTMNDVGAFDAESFSAESKPRGPYVFPKRKAFPIGDIEHAKRALVFAEWPNNKKNRAKVRRAVFKRYPQLRKSAESFEAENPIVAFRYKDDSPAHVCRGQGYTNTTRCGQNVNWDRIHYPYHLNESTIVETLGSVDYEGRITFGPSARKRICLRCYRSAAQDFDAESFGADPALGGGKGPKRPPDDDRDEPGGEKACYICDRPYEYSKLAISLATHWFKESDGGEKEWKSKDNPDGLPRTARNIAGYYLATFGMTALEEYIMELNSGFTTHTKLTPLVVELIRKSIVPSVMAGDVVQFIETLEIEGIDEEEMKPKFGKEFTEEWESESFDAESFEAPKWRQKDASPPSRKYYDKYCPNCRGDKRKEGCLHSVFHPQPHLNIMRAESFEAPKWRGKGKRKKVAKKSRMKYRKLSKMQKRWLSAKIREIMRDWKKSGRIGTSKPANSKVAQRQAIAVAYSMAGKKFK